MTGGRSAPAGGWAVGLGRVLRGGAGPGRTRPAVVPVPATSCSGWPASARGPSPAAWAPPCGPADDDGGRGLARLLPHLGQHLGARSLGAALVDRDDAGVAARSAPCWPRAPGSVLARAPDDRLGLGDLVRGAAEQDADLAPSVRASTNSPVVPVSWPRRATWSATRRWSSGRAGSAGRTRRRCSTWCRRRTP